MNKLKGFSLIELMFVLLLISVIVGSVSISITGTSPEKRLNTFGLQLFATMNFAVDEALMQRHPIGFRIENKETESTYHWYRYNNERWSLLGAPLKSVTMPENIIIDVAIESEFVESLLEQSLNSDEEKIIQPDIIFFPNGEISEFTLTLSYRDTHDSDATLRITLNEYAALSHSLEDVIQK